MTQIHSLITRGLNGQIIDVACRLSNGLPQLLIIGSAGRPVAEAKDRLRAAFAASGLVWPKKRMTINLSPAELPKADTGLDAAIARAILAASGQADTPASPTPPTLYIGEVDLDGSIRPVRDIIGKLLAGRAAGWQTFAIPAGNLPEAAVIPGIQLVALRTLRDLQTLPAAASAASATTPPPPPADDDYGTEMATIVGQPFAKRALEIAAAGGHHILLQGPPGEGKSLLAQALLSLLPPLDIEAALEVAHLHSLVQPGPVAVTTNPPLRLPHHTIRPAGLLGSAGRQMPGELSLAHNGVLYLDELAEWSRTSLECLRQPLETRQIQLSGTGQTLTYPANCLVVATTNPCPCGFLGESTCTCPPYRVQLYLKKLSGPLLDRFQLYVTVLRSAPPDGSTAVRETSAAIRQRVTLARQRQLERQGQLNGHLSGRQLAGLHLGPAAAKLLDDAVVRFGLSLRRRAISLSLARTIADLAEAPAIDQEHLAEALQFRPPRLLTEAQS